MSPTLTSFQFDFTSSPFCKIKMLFKFSSLSDLCLLKSSDKSFSAEIITIRTKGTQMTGKPLINYE